MLSDPENFDPTSTKLPLRYGHYGLDVFEFDQCDKTSIVRFNALQEPRSNQQLGLAKDDRSIQSGSEGLPGVTTTYMQLSMPWLKIPPYPSSLPVLVDQIVSLFFLHHVLTTDVYTVYLPGYLEELPSMYHDASDNSALVEAVKSVALVGALGRDEVDKGSCFYEVALHSYSQALRKLRLDLQEANTATNDATLMTIIMLDQMETYCNPDHSLPLGAHFSGLTRVMQLRGKAQLFSSRGWSLFRIAHHRLLNRQLMTYTKPLPESRQWISLLNKQLPYTKNASLILETIDAVSSTRSFLDRISSDSTGVPITGQISFLLSSITRLDSISQKFTDWIGLLPVEWKYISQSLTPELTAKVSWLPISRVHLHRTSWVACQWQWHHAAHIILLETLRTTLIHTQRFQFDPELSTTQSRITQCTNTIVRLAYDILSDVPQLLNIIDSSGALIVSRFEKVCAKQIGGYFAMFAMDVVQIVPSTTGEQKVAAAETLRKVRWPM